MDTTLLIQSLRKDFEIALTEKNSSKEIQYQLAEYVNYLIIHDFNKLVSLLYRIDVSEAKLKYLLKENPAEDAASIIADLIIERQLQKIKFRQQFTNRDDSINEQDKW